MSSSFIVIEGIDGSGIGTQVEALRTWCEDERIPVYATKEPSDGPSGALLKLALEKRVDFTPSVMALLFAADRLDHLEHHIEPRLAEGDNVVSDRYYLSSFAYQSEEVEFEWLRHLNFKCRRPDMTIFLDVPVATSLGRWESDQWRALDRLQLYETEETLIGVRENYLQIIGKLRDEGEEIAIVDGRGSIEAVQDEVLQAAAPILRRSDAPNSLQRPPSTATQEIKERLGLRRSAG